MKLVERHIFVNRKDFDNICFLSKNLYNYCNYILRQEYFEYCKLDKEQKKDFIKEYSLSKQLANEKQKDYTILPSQTAQQTIKLLFRNWKSFWKSLKDYNKNPSKYKGKPKPPRYKHKTKGKNIVIFTNQQVKIRNGYIKFPSKAKLKPIQTKVENKSLKQVRIIPEATCYVVEIVYERGIEENEDLDKNLYLGIDLGINNLATCVTNTAEKPLLVNGKIIKSINQYYNKKKSVLMSYVKDKGTSNKLENLTFKRNNKINDYLHKTSKFIVNYCLEKNIGNIVIGYNEGWKQNVKIGKSNNQKFVSIPFLKLIQQLKYKSELVGITVETVKENHTSKCDSFALESIKHHEQYKGKRKKRGLFQSSIKTLVNADVNGAINILRKVIGNSFIDNRYRLSAAQPVTVNPL